MEWNPNRKTLLILDDCIDRKKAFKVFRNSSSAYGKNSKVRSYVLDKCNNKCVICGSLESLEVDHIISVHNCFNSNDYFKCNTLDNLQILCANCNNLKGV